MEPYSDYSPLAAPNHLPLLTVQQRQTLEAFYAETPVFLETSHHQTTSGIFVTIHQEYSAERSTDPNYHAVATCRRLGATMLREAYDVHTVQFTPTLDRGHHSLEKTMHLTSRETDKHAVIRLGKLSLWIEQDNDGYMLQQPLSPFDLGQLITPKRVGESSA